MKKLSVVIKRDRELEVFQRAQEGFLESDLRLKT
jgi:hypothetical protein